jgi:hypothetical protein
LVIDYLFSVLGKGHEDFGVKFCDGFLPQITQITQIFNRKACKDFAAKLCDGFLIIHW